MYSKGMTIPQLKNNKYLTFDVGLQYNPGYRLFARTGIIFAK